VLVAQVASSSWFASGGTLVLRSLGKASQATREGQDLKLELRRPVIESSVGVPWTYWFTTFAHGGGESMIVRRRAFDTFLIPSHVSDTPRQDYRMRLVLQYCRGSRPSKTPFSDLASF